MTVQDPVKVDPKHYKVDVENEKVRVLRINYGAHEKSVMHSHPDGVAIFQNDIHCRFTFPDGKTEEQRFHAARRSSCPPEAICQRTWAISPSTSYWSN
jgi:hypothetical protein